MAVVIEKQLLKDVTSNVVGDWFNVQDLNDKSIHIYGTFSAIVKVFGSNEDIPTTGAEIASVNAEAMIAEPSMPKIVKWLRCEVTAYISGTINARLIGRHA